MENKFENGRLTVRLCGRVDSANAPQVDEELLGLAERTGARQITLDAADTAYLSSAGLRILLKLKKRTEEVEVVNVSPTLYEVLELTGFTDLVHVERALRQISVDGCQVLGEGGFGVVYRLDEDTIVKIYKSTGLPAVRQEIELAKRAFVKGVPTAISYDIVQCGDRYGVVFEMVHSDMLANRINAEPERLEEYVDKYVELIRRVHATDFSDVDCPRAGASYVALFERTMKDVLSPEEWAAFLDIIAAVPERDNMIHGDMHAKNIMVQGDELLLIDMDELMRGHPIYDIADIYYAYRDLPKTGRSQRFLNMDEAMCARFLDAFTRKYFAGLQGETLDTVLTGVGAFASLRGVHAVLVALFTGSRRAADPQARLAQLVQAMRADVLPYRDAIALAAQLM